MAGQMEDGWVFAGINSGMGDAEWMRRGGWGDDPGNGGGKPRMEGEKFKEMISGRMSHLKLKFADSVGSRL